MSGILNVLLGTGGAVLVNATLHAGFSGSSQGYVSGSYGTLTPSTDTRGHTVVQFNDPAASTAELAITGFSADPGKAYFGFAIANSVSLSAASATYSYSAGRAQWTWTSGWGLTSGNNYTVSII
jgi:hypothetical protein